MADYKNNERNNLLFEWCVEPEHWQTTEHNQINVSCNIVQFTTIPESIICIDNFTKNYDYINNILNSGSLRKL